MNAVYRVVNREAAARGAALPAALLAEACSCLSRSPSAAGEPGRASTAKVDHQQQQGAQQQGAPRPTRWTSRGTLSPSSSTSPSPFPLPSLMLSSTLRDAGARRWIAATHPGGLQQRAGFSSRAGQLWDNLTLPARQAQLREAKAIAQLLPHRLSFAPQFSPHGIQLMPKAVLQQQQQQQAKDAAGTAPAAPGPQTAPAKAPSAKPVASKAAAPIQPQRRSASTLHDWGAEGDADASVDSLEHGKVLHRLKLKQKLIRLRRAARGRKGDGSM